MSENLAASQTFDTHLPASFRDALSLVKNIADQSAPPDEIVKGIARNADLLKGVLPHTLRTESETFKRWFVEAALLWSRFASSGGKVLFDSLGSRTLPLFTVDFDPAAGEVEQLRQALMEVFGVSHGELDDIEQSLNELTATLDIKTRVCRHLADRLNGGMAKDQLFRSVYGTVPMRAEALEIVVTESSVFFCVDFNDGRLSNIPGYKWSEAEQRAFERFLDGLSMEDSHERTHFPAVGKFNQRAVSDTFVAELHAATGVEQGTLRSLLGTMQLIVPKAEAEKFLVHDAWGHAWQESLCEFEWLYADMNRLRDPVDLNLGPGFGGAETPPLLTAFSQVGGRWVLDRARAADIIQADLQGRLVIACNAMIAELLADIVEHKFSRIAERAGIDFPSSSRFKAMSVRLDLSLKDIQKHLASICTPFETCLDRRDIANDLVGPGADEALDALLNVIEAKTAPLRSTNLDVNIDGDTIHTSTVQRLSLNLFSTYLALERFLARGRATQLVDGPAWHHPPSCLDFLVIALGWFFERDRSGFMWHLDELLDGPLYDAMEALGGELRRDRRQFEQQKRKYNA